MGCLKSMAKYLIFLFNLLIVLAALAFIIIGVLFKLELDKEVFKNNEEVQQLALAPILLIVVGCIVFLIAFLGCCGAVQKSTCMLTTYGIILLIILALQLALGIFAFVQRDKIDFKTEVFKAIKDDLPNYNTNNATREYIDYVQQSIKCCGVESPGDWKDAGLKIPKTCYPNEDVQQPMYSKGCGQEIYDTLMSNIKTVGIIAVVICAIELVGAILAFWVANGHKRGHYA